MISGGTVAGGTGFQSGQALGSGIFLAGSVDYSVTSGKTVTIADSLGGGIDSQITGGFTKSGPGTLVLTGNNSYTGGTTINSGTLQIGNGGTTGSLGSGPLANNALLVVNRSDDVAIANVTGSGSIIKRSAGMLTLSGSGSNNLSIEQGHVRVTGDYSAATGLTFLNLGATISGTGTLGGSLQGSGLFSPGVNGTGVLSVNGTMTMGNNSSFLVELQGTTPGSGHDQISLTGSYVLNNTALLMDRLGDYEAPFQSSFVIIRNSSGGLGGGIFADLPDGALFDFDGQVFQIRYNVPNNYIVDPSGLQTGYAGITWSGDNGFGINGADNGGNIVIAAVPEPATFTMLLAVTLSVVSYAGYRHRKWNRNKRIGR